MLVEGRMLCHSQFVKALVLRVSLMLSQPCLEQTKCLTDRPSVRHFVLRLPQLLGSGEIFLCT